MASRQVSWWSVHQYVTPLLEGVGSWPMAGTPEWCAFADDDPRKLAALLDGAQHHALRVETSQEARAQASQAIAAAADWPAIANMTRRRSDARRSGAYIPRKVS